MIACTKSTMAQQLLLQHNKEEEKVDSKLAVSRMLVSDLSRSTKISTNTEEAMLSSETLSRVLVEQPSGEESRATAGAGEGDFLPNI